MAKKVCYKCNLEKDITSKYYLKHSEIIKNKSNNYKLINKNKISISSKIYRKNNKKKIQNYKNDWKLKHPQYNKQYYINNKEQIRLQQDNTKDKRNEYLKNRRKNDINFRLVENLRCRIRSVISGNNKSKSTMELIGCDIEFLKIYLQYTAYSNDLFELDINNYNSSEYHIDHIKPCASFDMSKSEEQKKCFHYSNFQILTSKENMSKGDKYE